MKSLTATLRALFGAGLLALSLPACIDGGSLSAGVKDKENKASLPDDEPSPSPSPSRSGSAVGSFEGCKDGQGESTSSIDVNFDFVPKATQMNVYRDDVLVFSTESTSVTSFIDTGLTEGRVYRYTCEAIIDNASIFGLKVLNLTPLSFQAPTFAGIKAVSALSPTSVLVEWDEATGVPASEYRVFARLGAGVEWTANPTRTLAAGKKQVVLTSLGDELPYGFGVRACNASGVCDNNTVVSPLTLADGGAPTTSGATSATLSNDGVATINAPWQSTNGAVKIRRVYQTTGDPLVWANYTPARTVTVPDITNPTQAITIPGIADNTTVYFIVRDTDPSGQENTSMNYVSVLSGDKTAPVFAGITALNNVLTNATTAEGTLRATWTAIASEPADPNGASTYLIYLSSAVYPNTPANACSAGTLYAQTNSIGYTANSTVNFDITGLSARTYYDVCVKARDAAGNESNTSNHLIRFTKDQTAPAFDGITTLAFDYGVRAMQVGWDASTSTDAANYRIRIWKNTATPAGGDITTITRAAGSYPTGSPVSLVEFPIVDNDVVYAVVDACDDAASAPVYNASNNCTNVSVATAISATVPDLSPPAGFAGIAAAVPSTQGAVTISWNAPADWADYAGFKIYKVDNTTFAYTPATDLLKTCSCTANNCSANNLTSCEVTGLNLRRTYTFYVTAIDAAGNETNRPLIDPDPVSSHASARTTDTTAPVFNPNLLGPVSMAGVTLSWNAATDTQYATEPGAVINYRLYRKDTTDFAAINPSTGPSDGTLIYSGTTAAYTDNTNIVQGATIYYTLCARDASNNQTCYVRSPTFSVTVPDITPPVIANLRSNKQVTGTSWTLSWSVTDNAPGNINVSVHRGPANACPSNTDDVALKANGVGLTSYADSQSPASASAYFCYVVTATDASNNSVTATAYDLNPAPTVATVSPAQSTLPETGGDTLTITGTGFMSLPSAATVALKLGSTTLTCASPSTNETTQTITCTTPAPPSPGAYDVIVTNFDGQSATKAGAFTYTSFCDAYGTQTPASDWAGKAQGLGGDGLSLDTAYKICNYAQFNAMRNFLGTGNPHFKLMDDITLDDAYASMGTNYTTVNSNSFQSGSLNGNFKTIYNLKVPLFNSIQRSAYVKNLTISNPAISGSAPIGALANRWYPNTAVTIEGIRIVGGTVTSTSNDQTGGMFGALERDGGSGFVLKDSSSSATVQGGAIVGGLVGQITGGFTVQDCNATGNVFGSSQNLGGFAGNIGAWGAPVLIERCYATGNVQKLPGGGHNMAGFAWDLTGDGTNAVIIRKSFATGTIGSLAALGSGAGFAGNVGSNNVTVEDCYAGNTSVASGYGTASFASVLNSGARIQRSHGSGALYVNDPNPNALGGFLVTFYSGTLSNNYWNRDTTGVPTRGVGNQGTGSGFTPLTSSQMLSSGNFSGWDFTNTWAMGANGPVLRCVTPGAPCP